MTTAFVRSHVWDETGLPRGQVRGRYVAISGNTGCGKSTLVRALAAELSGPADKVVAIDERALHHPFLTSMFFAPDRFALGIQLNFLVQRYLVLRRWLDAGFTVVIERSHLDDKLFIESHHAMGHVNAAELAAYRNISTALQLHLPLPDLVVCLEVPPDTSLERIKAGERAGERAEEFPDESVKRAFVESWHRRYQEFHRELYRQGSSEAAYRAMRLLSFSGEESLPGVVRQVVAVFRELGPGVEPPTGRQGNV